MNKNINVPKLRFKEFSGEWEDKLFGEIATNKSKKYNPQKDKNSYKCIELEHLSSENGFLLGYIDSLNSESIKNMFNKNDVLFGKLRPYLKKYLLAPFDGVCSSEIWVLNGIEVSNTFLYYIVQGEYFINLANQSSGSKMPRADWDNIANSIFFIPQKQEQEKIAIFLSSIDEKIEKLTKKDELLQKYKKSIMQKIFSQEIRFKDDKGNEFPEWKIKRIKEISTKKSSNISANTLENNEGKYKIYGAIGYLKSIDFYTEEENYISIVKDGAGVGRIMLCDSKSSVLGTLDIIKNMKNINIVFMFLILSKINFDKYIVGSTIPHIYYKDYSNEKVKTPCLEEQNKIANFLSLIDDKIEENQKILEKTKEFKKSLLQQMFI